MRQSDKSALLPYLTGSLTCLGYYRVEPVLESLFLKVKLFDRLKAFVELWYVDQKSVIGKGKKGAIPLQELPLNCKLRFLLKI
jgi:hypothetical protein